MQTKDGETRTDMRRLWVKDARLPIEAMQRCGIAEQGPKGTWQFHVPGDIVRVGALKIDAAFWTPELDHHTATAPTLDEWQWS